MAPPRIRLRGLRSPNIPGGYILGRQPGGGSGEVQLLNLQQLRAFGLAPSTTAAQTAQSAGFGFYDGGLLAAGELLGTAVFAHDVTFTNGADGNVVTALVPATGTPFMTLVAPNALMIPTQVGTINFAGTVGTVVWSPNPFLLLKGLPLKLFAPASADATLADISGLVVGVRG